MTKKQRRKLWVDALLSGKYKQAQDRLRTDSIENEMEEGFCCLGVACNIFKQEAQRGFWRNGEFKLKFTEPEWEKENHWRKYNSKRSYGSAFILLAPIAKWFGISKEDMIELVDMNDYKYWGGEGTAAKFHPNPITFAEIAEVIKRL